MQKIKSMNLKTYSKKTLQNSEENYKGMNNMGEKMMF